MAIKEEILNILNTPKFYYKGIPINGFFLPVFKENKKQSIRNEFNQLYKNGYVNKLNGNFIINKKGKYYLKKYKKPQLKNFEIIENKGPKNLLLLYDIPEPMKKERDWFRRTLIKFGFVMVQKSVWVGPSPIPKEFSDYVKSIGLKNNIKIFKLKNGYKPK